MTYEEGKINLKLLYSNIKFYKTMEKNVTEFGGGENITENSMDCKVCGVTKSRTRLSLITGGCSLQENQNLY